MRTILADGNSDILLGSDGNIWTITGPLAIEQACVQAMLALRGEMIHEKDRGMPYFETAWGSSPQIAQFEAAGRATLEAVRGVIRVVSFVAQTDAAQILGYSATIEHVYGVTTING